MMKKNDLEILINTTKIKLIVMTFGLLLPLVIVPLFINDDLIIPRIVIQLLVSFIMVITIVLKIMRYIKILSDETYAKNYLIAKQDERNVFIRSKSYLFSHKLILYVKTIAMIIVGSAGNAYIFYTLLGTIVITLIVTKLTEVYYKKKY